MNDLPYLVVNYAYLPKAMLDTVNFDFEKFKGFFKEKEMVPIGSSGANSPKPTAPGTA